MAMGSNHVSVSKPMLYATIIAAKGWAKLHISLALVLMRRWAWVCNIMLAAPVIMHTYISSVACSMLVMCSVGVLSETKQYITSGTRAKVYIHLYIVAVL